MATKKAVKKTAAKKTGTSMAKWDEELARRAAIAVATAESSSHGGAKQIKTSGGRLQIDGAEIPGNKMNVVILDHCIEHALYEGKYDPDNPQPPIAWALGRDEATLRWDETSIEELAGELTKDSECNQFGSADTGRGKAAKNIQRLMLITEADLDDIPNAEPRMLKVPVMSVKGWNGYVKQVNEMFTRPPIGVLTEISLVPDAKSQFRMQFKLVEELSDEFFGELFPKADSIESDLFQGYEQRDDEEEEQPQRGKAKKAARGVPAQRKNAKVVEARPPLRRPGGKAAAAPQADAKPARGKAAKAAPAGKAAGKRKF